MMSRAVGDAPVRRASDDAALGSLLGAAFLCFYAARITATVVALPTPTPPTRRPTYNLLGEHDLTMIPAIAIESIYAEYFAW